MKQEPRFVICTFNVHNLGRADNQNSSTYESKLDYLCRVLERVNPDCAVIDEVREPESFDELADRLGTFTHRVLADAPDRTRRIQVGLLSRPPVLDTGQWLDFPAVLPGETRETRLQFRRALPWARVELPNRETLFVAAVHLKSRRAAAEETPEEWPMRSRRVTGRSLANLIRIAEAAGLRLRLDEVMDHKTADHYAVLGDFNDTLHSTTVSLVSGLEDEEGSELVQSEERRLFPIVLPVPPERAFSYVGRGQRHLFDHILVSQDLSLGLVRAGVESQLLEAERRSHTDHATGYPRSDHAPVWAEFRLRPEPRS
jgi:endonuclease/exonuclease/phosphatase family metal-dependent hydrolase